MDALRKATEAYSNLNERLTWKSALLCAGAAGATYTLYSFAVKPFLSPLRKIPGPDYGPLFGNVREAMVGEAMQTSIGWIKKYGGIVRFYHLFGRERVLIADPEGLRHVLVTNVDNYVRPFINNLRFGSGIFTVSGEEHRLQRRLLNPFFNHQHIQRYLYIFEEKTAQLLSLWKRQLDKDGEAFLPVQDDLMRMTLDVIGRAVFGYEFNSLENPQSEANEAFRVITGAQNISFTGLIPFWDYVPTKANRRFDWGFKVIDGIIYKIIGEKRTLLSSGGEELASKDLLGKLMCVKDPETGKGFTDKELRDQVLSLLIAGHETTGAGMSWILLLLAQHEHVQDKVREEACSILPEAGDGLSWDHLDRLVYLQAAIKEGQRLYPSAPSFYRKAVADDTVCGYFIPKDTLIAYHVGAMMRNPAVWPEPDQFQPERFLEGEERRHLYTHLPFITGPHTCLGHQFARMQMRTVLSALVKELKFRVKPGSKFVRKLRVTMKAYPSVSLLTSKA